MQPCLICDTSFKPYTKTSFYCSPRCRNKAWKIRNREQYLVSARTYMTQKRQQARKGRKSVFQDCIICNTRFKKSIYHPEQKCCSTACNTKYYRQTHPQEVLSYKRKSNLRHREHIARHRTLYRDQLRFSGNRLRALQRDGFTCQNCEYVGPEQTDDRSKDVVVHHLDFSGHTTHPNNKIENLQTLCRPCHIRLHTHKLK